MYTPKVGDKVGAERWPYHAAHPDAWGKPWSGTVLAHDDVRAWTGTLAFPGFDGQPPTRAEVRRHVAWCRERFPGWDARKVPVLWDFGPMEKVVFWESVINVRSYADDLAAWTATKWGARRAA